MDPFWTVGRQPGHNPFSRSVRIGGDTPGTTNRSVPKFSCMMPRSQATPFFKRFLVQLEADMRQECSTTNNRQFL